MLACDEIVTFIRCDGEAYTATQVVGVSWYAKAKEITDKPGRKSAHSVVIRIPEAAVVGFTPAVGDQVVRGALPVDLVVEMPADLAPYAPRLVLEVGDNRRGRLSHWAVHCQ